MVIVLDVYQSLKGSGTERVSLKFEDLMVLQDSSGNGITTAPLEAELSGIDYIDPVLMENLDSAAAASMIATLIAMSINLGISLIFGGSISAMWVMVNAI